VAVGNPPGSPREDPLLEAVRRGRALAIEIGAALCRLGILKSLAGTQMWLKSWRPNLRDVVVLQPLVARVERIIEFPKVSPDWHDNRAEMQGTRSARLISTTPRRSVSLESSPITIFRPDIAVRLCLLRCANKLSPQQSTEQGEIWFIC
jgi:hypothetical protein